jgi:hypothetical protein
MKVKATFTGSSISQGAVPMLRAKSTLELLRIRISRQMG